MIRRLLRRLILPAPTHLRAATGREGRGRVDTRCGLRVHHTLACDRTRAVAVLLTAAEPVEWSHLRPEVWVTCPTCRASEGWRT